MTENMNATMMTKLNVSRGNEAKMLPLTAAPKVVYPITPLVMYRSPQQAVPTMAHCAKLFVERSFISTYTGIAVVWNEYANVATGKKRKKRIPEEGPSLISEPSPSLPRL